MVIVVSSAPAMQKGEEKLAELILYISQKCASDPCFGAIKLNKILYFSDFFAYANWGKPISGAEYQNLRKGPAPRRLVPVREYLESQKALVVQPVQLKSGNVQRRTINLREPKLEIFTAAEISLVDQIIAALQTYDAEQSSELSHRMIGWKMTKEGETIPYSTIFLSNEPLSDAEIQRGLELAAELKSLAA
jgi:hypothetical protein